MIPTRHAHVTKQELREEGKVESREDNDGGNLRPVLVIHSAEHLGPPVVDTAKEAHNRAANHNVMEVSNHEIRIGKVDVHTQTGQKQPSEAADSEQAYEA